MPCACGCLYPAILCKSFRSTCTAICKRMIRGKEIPCLPQKNESENIFKNRQQCFLLLSTHQTPCFYANSWGGESLPTNVLFVPMNLLITVLKASEKVSECDQQSFSARHCISPEIICPHYTLAHLTEFALIMLPRTTCYCVWSRCEPWWLKRIFSQNCACIKVEAALGTVGQDVASPVLSAP